MRFANRTALRVASAAESCLFGRGLDGGDDWQRLRKISGEKIASLATESDLWRDQSTALSETCERGSAEAKRAGKERGQAWSRWQSPQASYGGQWSGHLPVPVTETVLTVLLLVS